MKVLAFGEVLRDVYPDSAVLGGAPLNFCAHCVKCGGEGYVFSGVGKDEAGREVLEEIRSMNVNTDFVDINDKPTGTVLVTLNEKMVPTFNVLSDMAYDNVTYSDDLVDRINAKKFDAFYFGTLAQRSPVSRATVRAVLKKCSFPNVFCDLNLRNNCYDADSVETCLKYATILKISDEEEPRLHVYDFWNELRGETLADLVENLFRKYLQLNFVIITKGPKGSEIFERGKSSVSVPAEGKKVVSTVGAGDSFGAAWLTMFLLGETPLRAGQIASRVSDTVVAHKEAVPDYNINDLK